jgi:quercetin dioxygenase-like cupin family protein
MIYILTVERKAEKVSPISAPRWLTIRPASLEDWMRRTMTLFCSAFLMAASLTGVLISQQRPGGEMQVYRPAEIVWVDGPGSLPKGARFAVLEGDPAKEGLFTMRLSLPDGFRIPPHFHGGVEHITVIAGTFNVGMGESFTPSSAKKMPSGTFGFWPAGMRHFAFTEGDTVLQLHGQGPWTITYVNPADDPRTRK